MWAKFINHFNRSSKNNYIWESQTYSDRIHTFSSKDNGSKSHLFVYPVTDPVSFRYRVFNQLEALRMANRIADFFIYDELPKLLIEKFNRKIDYLHLVNCNYTPELFQLVNKLKAEFDTKIIVDFDDLTFDYSKFGLICDQLLITDPHELINWNNFISHRELTAALADSFTTSTDYLANYISQKYKKDVQVIPNFVIEETLIMSNNLYTRRNMSKSEMDGITAIDNQGFTIGYFSGTKGHQKNFSLVKKPLLNLLAKYKKLKLIVVGPIDIGTEFDQYQDQITRFGFQHYLDLQEIRAKVDVTIMPMYQNEFTNGKSEIKFFESALVGTIFAGSPTETYSQLIQDGENGFIIDDNEWLISLQKIIKQTPEYRKKIIIEARRIALQKYTTEAVANLW